MLSSHRKLKPSEQFLCGSLSNCEKGSGLSSSGLHQQNDFTLPENAYKYFITLFLLVFLKLSSIKEVSITPEFSLARFFCVKNAKTVKSHISSLENTGKVQFLVLSLQFGLMYLLQ